MGFIPMTNSYQHRSSYPFSFTLLWEVDNKPSRPHPSRISPYEHIGPIIHVRAAPAHSHPCMSPEHLAEIPRLVQVAKSAAYGQKEGDYPGAGTVGNRLRFAHRRQTWPGLLALQILHPGTGKLHYFDGSVPYSRF